MRMKFSSEVLNLDYAQESQRIMSTLRTLLRDQLKRRGLVVAVSGGIDSSLVAALCTKALGPSHVIALLMPDKDSSPETLRLSRMLVKHLEVPHIELDITSILEAVGCYRHQVEAIRDVIPEFTSAWKAKLVLANILEAETYRIYSVVAQSPDGKVIKERLSPAGYLGLVAATNFKQRVRKMMEYFHADRLNYAATGTPNRLEYDQGFFVKLGDGAADVKPIAHLYKTQVYQMARFLGLPDENCSRKPTTDTYSLPQSQEEFYFSLPYDKMDLCLWAYNHQIPAESVAPAVGLTSDQVQRVYQDIAIKRRTTYYLHMKPFLMADIPEIKL